MLKWVPVVRSNCCHNEWYLTVLVRDKTAIQSRKEVVSISVNPFKKPYDIPNHTYVLGISKTTLMSMQTNINGCLQIEWLVPLKTKNRISHLTAV